METPNYPLPCYRMAVQPAASLGRKVQTILCAGIKTEDFAEEIIQSGAKGGDRLVPVGQALELDPVWDGRNVLRTLSREITVM